MTAFAKINLITLTLYFKIHQHQPGRDYQYREKRIEIGNI
jgi:hypothetical protein